jgi:serine/threonine protein kinase
MGLSCPGRVEAEYAIKVFELDERKGSAMSDRDIQTIESMRKEIVALKTLRNNNIVRLYDVKRNNNLIYLIMELCNQGVYIIYIHIRA